MDERTRLIQGLDTARAKMRAIVERIGTDKELYPGWTIRQVLAHMAGWDDATATSLKAYAEGNEYSVPAYRGIDDYNEQSVATRRDLNYEQTRKEWEMSREELKAVLRGMPDEKFSGEVLYPWGVRGSVSALVEVLIDHDHHHAEEIQRLMSDVDLDESRSESYSNQSKMD